MKQERRRRPALWGVFLAAGAVAATLIAVGVVAHRDRERERNPERRASQSSTDVDAGATDAGDASAADGASAASLRHPCGGGGGACDPELVAWCDGNERSIACCARDLVATGRDGGCEPK